MYVLCSTIILFFIRATKYIDHNSPGTAEITPFRSEGVLCTGPHIHNPVLCTGPHIHNLGMHPVWTV